MSFEKIKKILADKIYKNIVKKLDNNYDIYFPPDIPTVASELCSDEYNLNVKRFYGTYRADYPVDDKELKDIKKYLAKTLGQQILDYDLIKFSQYTDEKDPRVTIIKAFAVACDPYNKHLK